MNKLLVVTDLSVPSMQAAHYAFRLASCLHMDLLLLYCTESQIADSLGQAQDERLLAARRGSIEALRQLSVDVRKDAETFGSIDYLPAVRYQWFDGPSTIALTMCRQGTAIKLLIVSRNIGERSPLSHSRLPMLTLPAGAEFRATKQIIFETDMSAEALKILNTVVELAEPFHAEIVVVPQPQYLQCASSQASRFMADIARAVRYTHIRYQEKWLNTESSVQTLIVVPCNGSGAGKTVAFNGAEWTPVLLV